MSTFLLAALLSLCGCSGSGREEASKAPDGGMKGGPPRIKISAERTDLLFTYIDEEGRFQTVMSLNDVPEGSRHRVKVDDLSLGEASPPDMVVVADLSRPGDDGSYSQQWMSRQEYEALLLAPFEEKKRQEEAEQRKALAQSKIILYSTAWCGVCDQARRFMLSRAIPFEERDVDKDGAAKAEVEAKLKAVGKSFSGVPILDLGGRIMQGFEQGAIEAYWRTVREAQGGKS